MKIMHDPEHLLNGPCRNTPISQRSPVPYAWTDAASYCAVGLVSSVWARLLLHPQGMLLLWTNTGHTELHEHTHKDIKW